MAGLAVELLEEDQGLLVGGRGRSTRPPLPRRPAGDGGTGRAGLIRDATPQQGCLTGEDRCLDGDGRPPARS